MGKPSEYADSGTVAHTVLETCLIQTYQWGMPTFPRDFIGQTFTVTDGEHSPLSPSGAKRWMTCPGSVALLAETRQIYPPRQVVFDADYAAAVQEILDYVAKRIEAISGQTNEPVQVIAERKVSCEKYLGTNDCDGTADITLLTSAYIEVIDAKFGSGVAVAVDDPQTELYLLGALAEAVGPLLPKYARRTIAQPRCPTITPRIRWVDVDIDDWMDPTILRFQNAVVATKQPDAPLQASEDGCRFCDVKTENSCKEYTRWTLRKAGVLDEDEDIPETSEGVFNKIQHFAVREPYQLTGAQLRGILDGIEVLRGALTAISAHAVDLMIKGNAPPELTSAYKLVHGRSNRKWAQDGAETERRLKKIKIPDPTKGEGRERALGKKDIVETKLKSITAIEVMLKTAGVSTKDARMDAFRALITKPEGALTLAPLSDIRSAVKGAPNAQEATAAGPDIAAPEMPGAAPGVPVDFDPLA